LRISAALLRRLLDEAAMAVLKYCHGSRPA
jgi:hypothetical protein